MKLATFVPTCLFLVIPLFAKAADNIEDVPINTNQELVEWCKNEVEQRYLAQDQVPRNWRVSHSVKANYLHARLTFRLNYVDKHAECKVRKGAQRRYAIFQEQID